MDHALTWVLDYGNQLTVVSLLLVQSVVVFYAINKEWIVLGPRFHDVEKHLAGTQAELKTERAGHDVGRDTMAKCETALAVANARISELERDLAECRGELRWQTSGRQPRRRGVKE